MKRTEKIAIVLIVAAALQGPAKACLLACIPRLMKGEGLSLLSSAVYYGSAIAGSFVALGCGLWLYLEAERKDHSKWIWCLFGLLLKLPAVAVFYGYIILETLEKNGKATDLAEATAPEATDPQP